MTRSLKWQKKTGHSVECRVSAQPPLVNRLEKVNTQHENEPDACPSGCTLEGPAELNDIAGL
eukprot:12895398-Prorocentrum_lima.AAC.1